MDLASKKLKIIKRVMAIGNVKNLQKIEELLDDESVDSKDSDLSQEEIQLLDKRLLNHLKNPNSGREWLEIKAELSKKYAL